MPAQSNRHRRYQWTKNSTTNTGKKFECLLVSEDSTQYCLGLFKRKGKEPGATQNFNAAVAKFTKGSIWKVSKITLANTDRKYLGCSHKVAIDLNSSSFKPVLQSTVKMPNQATPPEDLYTLLQCIPGQVIDVIAIVTNVSEASRKTTAFGDRDLVTVTIMDDSGDKQAAKSEFPAWFPTRTSGEPCNDLARLIAAVTTRVPMAFFNLVCQEDSGKIILKTSRQGFAFEEVRSGQKAERLLAKVDTLLNTETSEVSVVTELPQYQVQHDVDYANTEATLTVARLVQLARRSDGYSNSISDTANASSVGAREHAVPLYQINYCRIQEPTTEANLFTNDESRLWPSVRIIDSTGSVVDLKMRQKTALSLAGVSEADEFVALVRKGALNFPILCSIRVTMRKSTKSDDAGGEYIDMVLVEAEAQDIRLPKAMPNNSLNYVAELLHMVAPDQSRMIAAPMSVLHCQSHVGMLVDGVQASCVLSLLAHVGRSETVELEGGHKIISRGCWNVPFMAPQKSSDGAPEHADVKVLGEVASYCTMENVQD